MQATRQGGGEIAGHADKHEGVEVALPSIVQQTRSAQRIGDATANCCPPVGQSLSPEAASGYNRVPPGAAECPVWDGQLVNNRICPQRRAA